MPLLGIMRQREYFMQFYFNFEGKKENKKVARVGVEPTTKGL